MDGTLNGGSAGGMVVEFIGTPGAGKTTLVPGVKQFFAENDFIARTVVEAARPFIQRTAAGRLVNSYSPVSLRGALLWQAFYQISKFHRLKFRRENGELLTAVRSFQRQRPISKADRRHVLHWFVNLTGQYRFLKQYARPDEVLIFDEGFLHRVVQLFASEAETPDFERIETYLELVPQPDLIIHPRAALETCIERVHQRGIWARFRDREEAVISQFMHSAHRIVDFAVARVREKGWLVIEVDNDRKAPSDTLFDLRRRLSSVYSFNRESIPLTSLP